MTFKRENRANPKAMAEAIKTMPTSIKETEILPPTERVPQGENQYDSIMELFQKQQQEIAQLRDDNIVLKKKIAEARGDISEDIVQSKRRYGYELDGSRKKDELFEYGYSVMVHDRKEKAIIKSETIGRPINIRNENTGKWVNQHNVIVTFHDDSTAEMDVLDMINQRFVVKALVRDDDIQTKDGKKYYTFHTDKFGTFETAFIN